SMAAQSFPEPSLVSDLVPQASPTAEPICVARHPRSQPAVARQGVLPLEPGATGGVLCGGSSRLWLAERRKDFDLAERPLRLLLPQLGDRSRLRALRLGTAKGHLGTRAGQCGTPRRVYFAIKLSSSMK